MLNIYTINKIHNRQVAKVFRMVARMLQISDTLDGWMDG